MHRKPAADEVIYPPSAAMPASKKRDFTWAEKKRDERYRTVPCQKKLLRTPTSGWVRECKGVSVNRAETGNSVTLSPRWQIRNLKGRKGGREGKGTEYKTNENKN